MTIGGCNTETRHTKKAGCFCIWLHLLVCVVLCGGCTLPMAFEVRMSRRKLAVSVSPATTARRCSSVIRDTDTTLHSGGGRGQTRGWGRWRAVELMGTAKAFDKQQGVISVAPPLALTDKERMGERYMHRDTPRERGETQTPRHTHTHTRTHAAVLAHHLLGTTGQNEEMVPSAWSKKTVSASHPGPWPKQNDTMSFSLHDKAAGAQHEEDVVLAEGQSHPFWSRCCAAPPNHSHSHVSHMLFHSPSPSACYRATHGAKARGSDSSMDGLVGWSTSKHLHHKQRGGEHAHARKTETTHNMHTHERTCTGRGSATWCARTIASKCTGPQARKQGDLRAKRETPLQKLVLCEKEERCACKWVPCGAHNDIVIHVTSACQPEADEQGTQNRAGEKMKR